MQQNTLAQHRATTETTANPADRLNLYGNVHKALRAFMADTLLTVGKMDTTDAPEVERTLAQVQALLNGCAAHLDHENKFIHAAMEARRPNSAAHTADDHLGHLEAIAGLRQDVARVEQSSGAEREQATRDLYMHLALFVAENFVHMHTEEVENNAVLWSAYTDAELHEIHQALLASIPPQEMAVWMRWFVPSINAQERAEMLSGIRAGAPPEVFDAVMAIGTPHLSPADRVKLDAALKG
jgi:hypothetical protein